MEKKTTFLQLARKAAQIADDKKGEDILVLNIKKLTTLADYFVIVTGTSSTHIRAISDAIYKTFRDEGIRPTHRDGVSSTAWNAIDYGGLVVHVMSPEARKMYALEKIWADAKKV